MTPVDRAASTSWRPCLTLTAVALAFLALLSPARSDEPTRVSAEGNPTRGTKPAVDPGAVEVRYTDNSVMKLTLKEERIELVTAYGKLAIPVADVRRIEFGMRLSDETAKRVENLVANLGGPHFRSRETASAELLALKEKAYQALLKASKNADMEIAHRAEELLAKIRESVPEEVLNIPEVDVIHTDDSRITGRISSTSFRIHTFQFGELQLKLADIRGLRSLATPEPDAESRSVASDPGNLKTFEGQIGKTFAFRVTGALGGNLWGTDIYTTDSALATVVVHAGLLQPGQTGVVRATILGPQGIYQGSTRNGVSSSGYANYPGSYRVHR